MTTHPGKTLTIYDIPNLVATALPRPATSDLDLCALASAPLTQIVLRSKILYKYHVLSHHIENTDPYSQSLLPEYPAGSTRDTCLVSAILDHPTVCSGKIK